MDYQNRRPFWGIGTKARSAIVALLLVLLAFSQLQLAQLVALPLSFWGLLSVAACLLCIGVLMLINRLQSIQRLIAELDQLNDEQLSERLAKLSDDGSLGLMRLMYRERRQKESFNATLAELSHSASELNATSDQLATNTLQQSQATSSIAAAVTEISHSIEEVAGRLKHTHQSAAQSCVQGEQGLQAIVAVGTHMQDVTQCVAASHLQLQALEERTRQVSSSSTVIRDIAEQTNLLALNAAIEAARAGEHGRGFAVVAEEVRALANRSDASAKEISETLEEMHSQMAEVKNSIDQVMRYTELTVDEANSTEKVLTVIADHTQQVSSMVSAVLDATDQQSDAARDISERVEEVAVAAGENSAMAEQSSNIAGHLYNLCQQEESANV
ncbi:MAG: methyl-accepting chemotaxis protein [Cellvibrionaceae bacterium]